MKTLLCLSLVLLCECFHARASGSPVPLSASQTWAVVVGISDYQDPAIPDLRFAHRDAEAFAGFLRSAAGGSLDNHHIKFLSNEKATGAQFIMALEWLLEVAGEGDRVIIYFSGHGDVESKRISQPGYLLGWDAPSTVYAAGGTLNVRDFQDYVSTLSVQNKASVLLITDACHAGKLSGSAINGAQLTGQSLAQQYVNEIKILSCQSDEYSIEGEQWGGGRGAFSFNLVNALYGLADLNGDQLVTLQEVDRYLYDHVTEEVAPLRQIPVVVGNRTERLAVVDNKLLADLRAGRTSQMTLFAPIETRGVEDEVLAGVDSSIRQLFLLFNTALKDKMFLAPAGACADAYYEKLMAEPKLARLHASLKRNYAAALQDDAQQVLNKLLQTDLTEIVLSKKSSLNKYDQYPAYLARAAQLLGKDHYMYPVLQSRMHFFQGHLIGLSDRNPNKESGRKALDEFRKALDWQREMPHVYWQMGQVYGYNLLEMDSAIELTLMAVSLAPSWILPLTDMAYILAYKNNLTDKALPLLEKAFALDSNSLVVLNRWGIYHIKRQEYEKAAQQYSRIVQIDPGYLHGRHNLGVCNFMLRRYGEAEAIYRDCVAMDSSYSNAFNNLGCVLAKTFRYQEAEHFIRNAIQLDSLYGSAYNNLGEVYRRTGRNTEALQLISRAINLDPRAANRYSNLGMTFLNLGDFAAAEENIKKAIALDPSNADFYDDLGVLYEQTGRSNEAQAMFLKAMQTDTAFAAPYFNLALMYFKNNQTGRAFDLVEQALISCHQKFEWLYANPALEPLRAMPEWQALMKKFFPNEVDK